MMMSDPEELVGQRIDQYELRQHIARGGMADVYLAHDVMLNRKAALKILLPALLADHQFVVRFQREAQTVAQLEHPNIVQIYGISQTSDGRPYLAMQYVEGGSLRDSIEMLQAQGRLVETSQALGIISKMADALQTAHEAGVIHRDLKPSNILIRPNGTPVMVDLGIASVQGGPKLTHTGTLIGTPFYMSPEQASGKKLDGRSDIYSLGVILYELLAGAKPFTADDPLAVLHKHVYETPRPIAEARPDLTAATHRLVETCMQKEPEARFQTAVAMRTAIYEAIQAEGGHGDVSPSGIWRPQPTGEYRLSSSKITRPEAPTPAGTLPERARRPLWVYLLIPLLLAGAVYSGYRFFGDGGAEAADDSVGAAIIQPTRQAEEAAAAAAPTSTLAPLPTLPPEPTEEPTPQPSETPAPTETPAATDTPIATATLDPGPETVSVGRSVQNRAIEGIRIGSGPRQVIFIGGLHAGFAPGTVQLAQQAGEYFRANPGRVPPEVTLTIIFNANPDSPRREGELEGRLNANRVDLNRNWGCRWAEDAKFHGSVVQGSGGPFPFSEPETVALRDFIMAREPAAVIFWEARAAGGLSSPGVCDIVSESSVALTTSYGIAAGYQIADFENLTDQELNGDGTNWLDAQGVPAAAVLLPDYDDVDWDNNLAGMLAVLNSIARGGG